MTEFPPSVSPSEQTTSGQEISIEEHLTVFSEQMKKATTDLLGHVNGEVPYGNAQDLLEQRGTQFENKQVNQQYDAIIGLLGVNPDATIEQKARAIASFLGVVNSAVKQTLNPTLDSSIVVDAFPPSQ